MPEPLVEWHGSTKNVIEKNIENYKLKITDFKHGIFL